MDWLLLAEHNPLFREGLATLLEWRTGLGSVYAGSLAEAKGVLEEEARKPACIIVDLDLPDGGATNCSSSSMGYRCWRSSRTAA